MGTPPLLEISALALALACACTRPEEPQSSHALQSAAPAATPVHEDGPATTPGAAPTATPSASAAEPGPSAAAPASSATESAALPCVVARIEPPPPVARPAANCPKDPAAPMKLTRGKVHFKDAPAAPELSVERARLPAEHQRGLMFRTHMPENQGMIFEWPEEETRIFWMHNTCIPLDMMFIAKDGTVSGILEQIPVLNDVPRSVPCKAAYVLEVNAGWSRRHGVKPGMRATFD